MLLTKRGIFVRFFWLSLLVFTPFEVFASSLLGGYVQPITKKKVDQRRSIGTGSRSDCESILPEDSLTLLVPETEVVHQTASKRPSFFFYSTVASPVPLQFTLVEPNVDEPLVEKTLNVTQSGYWKIVLPDSIELAQGKVYLWHLAVPCANDLQQLDQVLTAAVERVRVPTELLASLEKANSHPEKASLYAGSGLWYDALTFANQDRSKLESLSYRKKLLDSVGINFPLSANMEQVQLN